MGSVDICIFTECPLTRLFSSLPTPPFHHLAGFSHNFFSFPSLSQNLCPCFHRITNRSFNMQRYSNQGPPTYPRSKICITLLPHLPATSQASCFSCSRCVLASFPFLVHQRIFATTGTPCIPKSNIPIHSMPPHQISPALLFSHPLSSRGNAQ